jgi:hypothetical protein
MTAPVLDVRQLTVQFKGDSGMVEAVRAVSFTCSGGKPWALWGIGLRQIGHLPGGHGVGAQSSGSRSPQGVEFRKISRMGPH